MNIVIDGCIFQLQSSRPVGISRFWLDFLPELQQACPDDNLILLERRGYPVKLDIPKQVITSYVIGAPSDDFILGQACQALHADVFMSTYYSRAPGVLNVLRIHDMIPEIFGWDLTQPEWVAKRRAIQSADRFVTTSASSARDLERFYQVDPDCVTISYTAAARHFCPASPQEVEAFRHRYHIHKKYFLLVGNQGLYKNGPRAVRAFLAASSLHQDYQLVTIGSEGRYQGVDEIVSQIPWVDDQDMKAAYTAAMALVYPSLYEGFGLPVLEAMRCGCPVIAGKVASIPEVAGEAAIYVDVENSDQIARAMITVTNEKAQEQLRAAGLAQARKFTWERVADCYKQVLEEAVRNG